MIRGPTGWIVLLAVVAAAGGFYLEHVRTHPADVDGVRIAFVGDPAPSGAYMRLDGKPQSLDAWRGRRVLLNFWATWCAPCRREMPMLSAAALKGTAQDVTIVGVAEDDAASVRPWMDQHPVKYPIVLTTGDGPGSSLSFGNTQQVLPYSVLIDRDGRILRRKMGAFSERELAEWLSP